MHLWQTFDVKDAHDRYANLEISYLLQRMELYDGVTILATTCAPTWTMLSPAVTIRRRFPFPEEEYRLRIWQTLFPPTCRAHPIWILPCWRAASNLPEAASAILSSALPTWQPAMALCDHAAHTTWRPPRAAKNGPIGKRKRFGSLIVKQRNAMSSKLRPRNSMPTKPASSDYPPKSSKNRKVYPPRTPCRPRMPGCRWLPPLILSQPTSWRYSASPATVLSPA